MQRMERGGTRRGVLVLMLACGSFAGAQDRLSSTQPSPPAPTTQSAGPGSDAGVAQTQPAATAQKPRGPKYLRLRYDEDFTYLDGPSGSYTPDFFDPIKNIQLSNDLRLSIGGEFRFRMEAETNRDFGATARSQDTFQIYRYLTHFDLRYRGTARLFVQGISAFMEERQLPGMTSNEDHWDGQQLFLDLRPFGDHTPLTVRIGREEMDYGAGRLVAASNWSNVRNRFDGVKLIYEGATWSFDLFYVKPVDVRRTRADRWNEEQDFYGAYFTYKGIPRHGIDAYFFAIDDTANRVNPNGRAGDISRYTIGSRFWGKTAGFDYETELYGQWGTWAGDTIQAWNWSGVSGYTFEKIPTTPRIAAAFDLATGDENPNDRSVGTVDPLYRSNHSYFGYLDLIGRFNVTDVNVDLSAWPVKDRVRTALSYYTFWLTETKDALYDTGGRASRRDPTGESGREIGHELDFTIEWTINVHSSLLLGWSHFWNSDFIIKTGPDDDPDFYYIQYAFRF